MSYVGNLGLATHFRLADLSRIKPRGRALGGSTSINYLVRNISHISVIVCKFVSQNPRSQLQNKGSAEFWSQLAAATGDAGCKVWPLPGRKHYPHPP